MEFSEEELVAAQNAVDQQKQAPAVETPVTTETTTTTTNTTDSPVNSSLTTAEVKTEPVIEPVKVVPATVETPAPEPFETQLEKFLAEKTAGKFTKFEEIQTVLDKPVEEYDDDIKRLQELKRSGTVLDKDYWELQNLNLGGDENGVIDTEFVVLEAMKRRPETKGLSDRTLLNLLNKKYDYSQWVEKDATDLTEDDLANRELMMRDAQNDLEYLNKLKEEKAFIKPADPEEATRQADARRLTIQNFEKMVDEDLFAKVTSLTTEIEIDKDTKEVYEYKISEADRKRAADMMKLSVVDLSVLVTQFAEKDASGKLKINDRKVYEMIIKNIVHDEAVKNAYKDGMAVGAKNFVKTDLKNANFTPQETPVANPIAQTEEEALRLAAAASGKKFT